MARFNEKTTVVEYKPLIDDNVRVRLSDGTVLEGKSAQVSKLLGNLSVKFDTNSWYNSTTKGWVTITSMATPHIRNAIVKRYAEWLDNLAGLNKTGFVETVRNGPDELAGLVAELARRKE